jgi:hypothetical protein
MTAEIYGYVELNSRCHFDDELLRRLPLCVTKMDIGELPGMEALTVQSMAGFAFSISDSKDCTDATRLLCPWELSDANHVPLPSLLDARLDLICRTILELLEIDCVESCTVVLTMCNEVDSVKSVEVQEFCKLLQDDCARECPPCIGYRLHAPLAKGLH